MSKLKETALVVFSGGQDSSTCILLAVELYEKVECITFDYGQKHKIELKKSAEICKLLDIKQTVIKTPVFSQIGNSALLADSKQDVTEEHKSNNTLPASFVPGRNLYFLTVASMYAYKQGIKKVITGVSQADYSGYPDCREVTIKSLQETINLGMVYGITIVTPLLNMSKKQEVELAMAHKNGPLLMRMSHTCYNGENPPCGKCPSCELRQQAFVDAGFVDPIVLNKKAFEEAYGK